MLFPFRKIRVHLRTAWSGGEEFVHLIRILRHYFIKDFFQPNNLHQPFYCRDRY